MKGRRLRRLLPQQQQQQRESVFTQACLCETRWCRQRGTLTAACHIQAPEELLLGLPVCVCERHCVSFFPPALLQITLQVCWKGVWVWRRGCKRLAIELHNSFTRWQWNKSHTLWTPCGGTFRMDLLFFGNGNLNIQIFPDKLINKRLFASVPNLQIFKVKSQRGTPQTSLNILQKLSPPTSTSLSVVTSASSDRKVVLAVQSI